MGVAAFGTVYKSVVMPGLSESVSRQSWGGSVGKIRVFIQEFQGLDGLSDVDKIDKPFASTTKLDASKIGGNDYVLVTVVLRSTLSVLGDRYDLRAATIVRNEPF